MPSIPLGEEPRGSYESEEQCPDPEGDPPPPPGGARSPARWSQLEARTVPTVPNDFMASDGRILPLLRPEEERRPPALLGRVGGVCTPLSQPAGMQADGVAGEGHQPVTTLPGGEDQGLLGTSSPARHRGHGHLRPSVCTHPLGTPFPTDPRSLQRGRAGSSCQPGVGPPRGPSKATPAGGGTSLLLAIKARTGFDAL